MSRAAQGPSAGPDGNLSAEDIRGYNAPFPDDMPELRAGAHVFPELVPTGPQDSTGRPQLEGGKLNRACWSVYKEWTKPGMCCRRYREEVFTVNAGSGRSGLRSSNLVPEGSPFGFHTFWSFGVVVVLLAFADGDPVLGNGGSIWKEHCPGTRGIEHPTIRGGHFVQDGGGKQLVAEIIRFIHKTTPSKAEADTVSGGTQRSRL